MLVVVVGPASHLLKFVSEKLISFITQKNGQVSFIRPASIGDFQQQFLNRESQNVFIECTEITVEIISLLKRAKINPILVFDDIFDYIFFSQRERNIPWHSAFRQYIRELCIIDALVGDPNLRVIRRDNYERQIETILFQLLSSISIDEPADASFDYFISKNSTNDSYSETKTALTPISTEDMLQIMSESDMLEVKDAVFSYKIIHRGKNIDEIRWKRSLFSTSDLPLRSTEIIIDTTGKSRHLVFGPYLYIPVGNWVGKIRFAVENAFSGCDLVFDVIAIEKSDILFEGEIPHALMKGAFSFEFRFTVTDPSTPIEIRVYMKSGSIEGYFLFGDVDMTRQ